MTSLWSPLRSRATAAGLIVLGLAACEKPAAPDPLGRDGPAFSEPPPITPAVARPSPSAPPQSVPAAPPVGSADALVALAESDPRAALLAASDRDLGPAAAYVRGNFLQLWAERDFTAAHAYAESQAPGEAREELIARLALVMARWIPAEAAAIVAQDMRPGPAQTEAAVSVVHRWAGADSAAASAWVAAFPAGPLRERAEREIAGLRGSLIPAASATLRPGSAP